MYAKTLFKPTRPSEIHSLIQSYNRQKTPYFFQYAKDKTPSQVSPKNNSCVNRIQDIIGNPKFDFQTKQLGKFNYKMLLYDKHIDTKSQRAQNIIADYKQLVSEFDLRLKNTGDEHNNYDYIAMQIKKKLVDKYYDDRYVCDVLVKHYFFDKKSIRKKMLMDCFSEVISENLRKNLDDNIEFCSVCGDMFVKEGKNHKMCSKCQENQEKISKKTRNKKYYEKNKTVFKTPLNPHK